MPGDAVATSPSARSSATTRATAGRAEPTASASACCVTAATRRPSGCAVARSRRWRATRWRSDPKPVSATASMVSYSRRATSRASSHPTAGSVRPRCGERPGAEHEEPGVGDHLGADGGRAGDDGRDAEELAGAGVGDGQGAAVGGRDDDADQPGDDEQAARVVLVAVDRAPGRHVDEEGVGQHPPAQRRREPGERAGGDGARRGAVGGTKRSIGAGHAPVVASGSSGRTRRGALDSIQDTDPTAAHSSGRCAAESQSLQPRDDLSAPVFPRNPDTQRLQCLP